MKPLLALVHLLLAEGKLDALVVFLVHVLERDVVVLHGVEVIARFLSSAGTETLVILYVPALAFIVILHPRFELRKCVEADFLLAASLDALDNRRDEFHEELRNL